MRDKNIMLGKIIRNSILIRIFIFVICPLLIVIGYLYQSIILASLPKVSEKTLLEGLHEEIAISRDENGVVYINASTDEDVYFAMGYAHAQDRLWQLEIQKRRSLGRLSEIFGKSSVTQDIWVRTLGIYQSAVTSISYLSPESIQSLRAYADGINAWIKTNPNLPVEFLIHGIEPEPWKIEYSLAWAKIFALNLAGNYQKELSRVIALEHLPHNLYEVFFPDKVQNQRSETSSITSVDKEGFLALFDISQYLENLNGIGATHLGSNAWVVSGSLTESGKPILANDPHLRVQIPSFWYPVKQKGKKLNVTGMNLVGLPVVVFGQNDRIAWGGTAMEADVQDLFYEQINPETPSQYLVKGKWKKFDVKTEIIHVKNDFPLFLKAKLKPIEIQVRRTENGPIISDFVKGINKTISLRWTGFEEKDTTYESLYAISYAKDWSGFRKVLSKHVVPALNMFYADVDNNIGFQGVGLIPLRYEGLGNTPFKSSRKHTGWKGFIPYEQMPKKQNPKSGILINANNRNIPSDYPHHISDDFAAPFRATRIEQLIKGIVAKGDKVTSQHMMEIQMDVLDLSVRSLVERMKKIVPNDKSQQSVLREFKLWQGEADKDSPGATIFYTWLRNIQLSLFDDDLSRYWNKDQQNTYLQSLIHSLNATEVDKLLETNSPYCDDISTVQLESCSQLLLDSFSKTIKMLTKLRGKDIENWKWGQLQETVYDHMPFSQINILDTIFERRIGNGGALHTINVAGSAFNRFQGYSQQLGASFRQVLNLNGHPPYFINSTGQSGQVVSPYYDNMISKFRDGKFYQFYQDEEFSKQSSQNIKLLKEGQ